MADDSASRLKQQVQPHALKRRAQGLGVLLHLALEIDAGRIFIRDTEPAAGIDISEYRSAPLAASAPATSLAPSLLETDRLGDLRSDVNAHPARLKILLLCASPVQLASIAPRHSKLVLVQASGNVGMRIGGDVRVYSHREARFLAQMRAARAVNMSNSLEALDVEQQDSGCKSAQSISLASLPTPEKTTFPRCFSATA